MSQASMNSASMSVGPIPFRNALVIANPIAGRGRGEQFARDVAAMLARDGVACEVRTTAKRGDATAFAASLSPLADLVVSIGGDGTLSEILSGLKRHDVTIGLLPLGTANVLSLDLHLPRDVDGFERVLAGGRVQAVDTALVNGSRLSFLVCGVGFDAAVVRALEARRKGPITRLDWVRAGFDAYAGWKSRRLTVEIDGQPLEGEFGHVLVSNIVHYAGLAVLDADRKLDDGLFEVYTFPGRSRTRIAGYLVRGALGRFPAGSVRMRRARRVVVRSDQPAPFQVDGDFGGETPFELAVGTQPFRILVPSGASDR
jgi:YegS/Rv2252/BmrU family lipid kinase